MYGYGLNSFLSAGTIIAMVSIIVLALVASVVLIVLGYVKFLGKNSDRSSGLGRFFHFDHFYIEQVLRFLYLASVVGIAVWYVASVALSLLSGSVGTFLASFIVGALMFLVGQFFCRIAFERSLIGIRQAVDIRALRNKIVGDVESPAASTGSIDDFANLFPRRKGAAAQPGGFADRQAGDPRSDAQSAAPRPGESEIWTCPSCGTMNSGAFCGYCGHPRP